MDPSGRDRSTPLMPLNAPRAVRRRGVFYLSATLLGFALHGEA